MKHHFISQLCCLDLIHTWPGVCMYNCVFLATVASQLIQSQFSLIIFCDNIRHFGSTKRNVGRAPRAHTAHGARNVLNKLCDHMHYQERNSSRRTRSLCAWYVFSYGHISKGHLTALSWLSHFRVPETLTFKTRLNAKLFLWKWVLFAWE